jgi:hypothetical protein
MLTTSAKNLAAELRTLANSLERMGDTEVKTPFVYFSYNYCGDTAKDDFLALAKVLPRPLVKEYSDTEFILKLKTDSMRLQVSIERSKVCTLIEPAREAVYECLPLLSEEEDTSIDTGEHAVAQAAMLSNQDI